MLTCSGFTTWLLSMPAIMACDICPAPMTAILRSTSGLTASLAWLAWRKLKVQPRRPCPTAAATHRRARPDAIAEWVSV
jgi:hypothetical protein